MSKEELLKQLEENGLDFDTRALIVNDVLDIINKQLVELKAENKLLRENNTKIQVQGYDYFCENAKLRQQLEEKDDEIEAYQKLINDICNKFYAGNLNDLPKKITKQVCEKIRELAKNDFEFIVCDECYNTVDKDVYISSMALTEILDQTEKGK